jgi:hypothetical protein
MVDLQVWPCSQLTFPSKTWFLWFIWIFSDKIQFNISPILSPNFTKYIPLSPASWDLLNNTKRKSQFLWNFQLWFNLIISEKIIQYSRTFTPHVQKSWNPANAPLLIESFSKILRTQSNASQFGGSHNYETKQTTLFHIWMCGSHGRWLVWHFYFSHYFHFFLFCFLLLTHNGWTSAQDIGDPSLTMAMHEIIFFSLFTLISKKISLHSSLRSEKNTVSNLL